MNPKYIAMSSLLVLAPALFAQNKETERLANSATVLQAILSGDHNLNKHILDESRCVLVFPGVKKVAIGIGGTYGRGALVCRRGQRMTGAWGAPVMYSLDQGSLGVQLGSTETDFVLAVVKQKGVDQIVNGKMKLGTDAAAAAGPTGAQATAYTSDSMQADVLTYSRTKGLFAGVSLAGASIEADNDANKALYGKEIGVQDIVHNNTPVVPAAKPLVNLLNKISPGSKSGGKSASK
jgi:lipid-binding SYLF domain-containing protein